MSHDLTPLRLCVFALNLSDSLGHNTSTVDPAVDRSSLILDGWEAGIRTPIGGSRVRSPTVRRPPNKSMPILGGGHNHCQDCGLHPGVAAPFQEELYDRSERVLCDMEPKAAERSADSLSSSFHAARKPEALRISAFAAIIRPIASAAADCGRDGILRRGTSAARIVYAPRCVPIVGRNGGSLFQVARAARSLAGAQWRGTLRTLLLPVPLPVGSRGWCLER